MKVEACSNLVMACDRATSTVRVYDVDRLSEGEPLEKGEIWSAETGKYGATGLKFRENTVFGNVLVLAGWNFAEILTYPGGKRLWRTNEAGNNPHSVEILPSGNVIVANSTGCNLRLFHTSGLLTGDTKAAAEFLEYPLAEAHGLSYDPDRQIMWALGDLELAAYRCVGEGVEERLEKDSEHSVLLPEDRKGGHDLSVDLTSPRYFWLTTNYGVLRFDKEEKTFDRDYPNKEILNNLYMKGLSNNSNGVFFYSRSNGGRGRPWEGAFFAGWSTDRLHVCRPAPDGSLTVSSFASSECIFYKCRAFYGKYQ